MEHKVFEHKLHGGAQGLIVNVPGAKVINLVIRFNSGFQFGDFNKYELPHLLEHLVAGGTNTNYPKHSGLSIEIEKNGAYHNARTSPEANSYIFEFADFELDRILDLLPEYFLEQSFTQEDIESEIGNITQELASGISNHTSQIRTVRYTKTHPWSGMEYEKRIEQLSSINREDIVNYYQKTHTFRNMRFYLTGNFPDGGEDAVRKIQNALIKLPTGERFDPDTRPGISAPTIVLPRDIDQIYYDFIWYTAELPEKLWPAASILQSIMGQGWQSRIFGKARDRGLAYGIGCYVGFGRGNSYLYFSGESTTDKMEELLRLIENEFCLIRSGDVSASEIEAFKRLKIGARDLSTQTVSQLNGWYMSEYEEFDEIRPYDEWTKKLEKVTVDQVAEVAKMITTTPNRTSAFLGPVTKEKSQRYTKLLDNISS